MTEKDPQVLQLIAEKERLIREVHVLETTLTAIYQSHGWKALLVYYRVRNSLLPEGTRRRALIKMILQFVLRVPRTCAGLKSALWNFGDHGFKFRGARVFMNESQSYRRDTDEITEQPLRVELLCDGSALPPTPDPSTAIPERDFSLHSGERQTAEALDGIRCDHRARYEKAADTIRNQFSDTESLFGLDIFCGTGYGAFLVNQLLGCSVLGIEGSSEAVTFANEHFPGKNLYYVYKRFPFELPSSIFDFVLCYESLEHVEDDGALLQNMAQTLKPRGFLFISVPNEAINSLSRNPNRFHFRHYHHKDITGRLSASFNLEIISWYGQNVYRMNEGVVCGLLDDTEMKLIEKSEGQFNVYVCRKRN